MTEKGLSPLDPSSFSRPDLAIVTNIIFNLSVNFDKKIFTGFVNLSINKIDENVHEVILDAKDLTIFNIKEVDLNKDLNFTISDPVSDFGSKLTIALPEKADNSYVLKIEYETSPNASGLQWLTPEQTLGKKHPYLFSQLQSIHARSFLPCQDTSIVKTKYSATISAPPELNVVMSAVPDGSKELHGGKLSHFIQNVPVPSYLIAIAIGAIESKKIGPRSSVWSEKEVLDASAFEFANTEYQLKTAEDICGPYVWGIYDLLVLPPSFPFGGMENPCLTFVTPTLLAGDRSLANVVAHEIAHSWSGNLVTSKNLEHFWLNEGFTVFIERKILGRLVTPQDQDFHAAGGLVDLQEAIKLLGETNPLTKLVVDLVGIHPDDAFSQVPYEKGHIFLRYLENVVGGPQKFEPFLRKYFDTFKFKSIDSDDLKNFFLAEFSGNEAIKQIDWDTWFYGTGMPPVIPTYDTSVGEICSKLKEAFISWDDTVEPVPITSDDVKWVTAEQIIHLLQDILDSEPLSITKLRALESIFELKTNKNSEIKFRWFRICVKAHWDDILPQVLVWVNEVGRMKFVRPLYRDLYRWEGARSKAIDNFKAYRKSMMHVVSYTVSKDLHIDK